MTEAAEPSLSQLLRQIEFILAEPLDLRRTDSETTLRKVRFLTAAATYFNVLTITDFGGRAGPARATGLVEHVIAPAFQTFEGEDPHPEPFEKAAIFSGALLRATRSTTETNGPASYLPLTTSS